jgi:hypothetical protein
MPHTTEAVKRSSEAVKRPSKAMTHTAQAVKSCERKAAIADTLRRVRMALAMSGLSILRMQCRLTRTMRSALELAKIEPVVAGNLSPALPGFVHCHDVVKTLARGVGQQVCTLQVAEA